MTVYLLHWDNHGDVICPSRYKARKERDYIVRKHRGIKNRIQIRAMKMSKRMLESLPEFEGW